MDEVAANRMIAVLGVAGRCVEQTTVAQFARPSSNHGSGMGQPFQGIQGVEPQGAVEENFYAIKHSNRTGLEGCVHHVPQEGTGLEGPLAPGDRRDQASEVNTQGQHLAV